MLYSTILAERWSSDEILKYHTEYDLYAKYIGSNFKIGRPLCSPLREDKSPSFCVYVHKNDNKLMWRDYSTGEGGDVFKFIQRKLNLSSREEAYRAISHDFFMNKTYPPPKLPAKPKHVVKEINVARKAFTKRDIEYWQQYGISEQTLKDYNVSALKTFFVNGLNQYVAKPGDLMFGWKVYGAFKIYRPTEAKEEKWRSSLSAYDLQGFEQLDADGDVLIITKALKDVMLLRELGYNAIAPPSETSGVPEVIMNNLKNRFTDIVVLFDNDAAGKKGSKKIALEYGLKEVTTPEGESKDISDYYKCHGRTKTIELLTNLLQ
jgi:hypothetical protein